MQNPGSSEKLNLTVWKKNWTYLVAGALALAVVFYPQHPDRFRDQAHLIWFLLWNAWVLAIIFKTKLYSIGPILSLAGFSALNVYAAKFSPYGQFALQTDGPAAAALGYLCLMVTGLVMIPAEGRRALYFMFELICLIGAVQLILKLPGPVDNRAQDASFLAMIYPSFLSGSILKITDDLKIYDFRYWYLLAGFILPPMAIFSSYSATGIFALIAVVFSAVTILHLKGTYRIRAPFLFAITTAIGGFGYWIQGKDLFSSNGRTEMWSMIFNWWWDRADPVLGTGLGTWKVLAPSVQMDHGWKSVLFYYAHNDWLEILFELGMVGVILSGIVYGIALFRTLKKRSWLFMPLMTLGVVTLSQSPLRISLMSIWAGLILRDSLLLDDPSETVL